jgi:glycosyltransferase involved in cell wall biosynthesis
MLPVIAEQAEVVLFTKAGLPDPATDLPVRALRVPFTTRSLPWYQIAVTRALKGFDGVFHGSFNVLPYRQPVPMIVTIYDLSFEHHPGVFPKKSQMYAFRYQARHAARTAAAIVTDSEFIRQEIVDTYKVDAGRVLVAHMACDPGFGQLAASQVTATLTRFGVRSPYVLAMGGARRRRLDVAIDAWRLARSRGLDAQLVVFGQVHVDPEPGLVSVGRCSDADVEALFVGAAAFMYTTDYEGYGMPALEALMCGTPLLCAPVASLPEVVGSAAEWCDAGNPESFAAGLESVLGDSSRAAALRDAGRARAAAAPTWRDAANVVLEAYKLAASR